MKKITIDSNIIMDFLFKRDGHEKAAELFKQCAEKELSGFVCAHEITTMSYFLEKAVKDKSKIRKSITGIMKRFTVIETNEKILNNALYSEVEDFEDAVIEASSKEKNVDYIITRNIKDFKKSLVKALTPEELLAVLKEETKPQKEI
jgi:predicted nucleic acid-binding protein